MAVALDLAATDLVDIGVGKFWGMVTRLRTLVTRRSPRVYQVTVILIHLRSTRPHVVGGFSF